MKMKKRAVAGFLVIILAMSVVSAAAVDNTEKTITISFNDLAELVVAGNSDYRVYKQSMERLEIALRDMKDQHNKLLQNWTMVVDIIITLQKGMATAEDILGELSDDLAKVEAKLEYAAQSMYLGHYLLSAELDIAQRKLSALEKDYIAAEKKLQRGLISKSALDDLDKSITNQRDIVKAAKKSIEDNLDALAKFLDIAAPVSLEGFPELDLSRITDRDLEADKAAYRLCAPDVAAKEKAMREAKRAYNSSNTRADRHALDAATREHRKAMDDAVRDFPKVFQDLYDKYDDYISSTYLADARKELEKVEQRYARGLVSENLYNSVVRAVQEAEDRYKQEFIILWLRLLEYEIKLK